jgi:hypothetical protein
MSLWFHARKYGWGWTPVTIQGWLVLAGFFVAVAINIAVLAYRMRNGMDLRSALITFLVWQAVLTVALIAICWMTGERPRWRWGD